MENKSNCKSSFDNVDKIVCDTNVDLLNKINDPIEEKRISNCRKLGITPEVPKSKENAKDRNKRFDSIRLKIKRKLNKLNIDIHLIPDELPLINDEHFNKAMVCSRSFELSEINYNISVCTICKERRLNMMLHNNIICHKCFKDKSGIKMFSGENNMYPGILPAELQSLTVIEQQLIAKISTCTNIHMLKHGGIAANGHCVSFHKR